MSLYSTVPIMRNRCRWQPSLASQERFLNQVLDHAFLWDQILIRSMAGKSVYNFYLMCVLFFKLVDILFPFDIQFLYII